MKGCIEISRLSTYCFFFSLPLTTSCFGSGELLSGECIFTLSRQCSPSERCAGRCCFPFSASWTDLGSWGPSSGEGRLHCVVRSIVFLPACFSVCLEHRASLVRTKPEKRRASPQYLPISRSVLVFISIASQMAGLLGMYLTC